MMKQYFSCLGLVRDYTAPSAIWDIYLVTDVFCDRVGFRLVVCSEQAPEFERMIAFQNTDQFVLDRLPVASGFVHLTHEVAGRASTAVIAAVA